LGIYLLVRFVLYFRFRAAIVYFRDAFFPNVKKP
jgi:hypothetical protein